MQPSPKQPKPNIDGEMATASPRFFMKMMAFRQDLRKFLLAENVAGILLDSNKEHGLLNMTGATSNFTPAELPEAFLTTESYGLIWRLLKRTPVELEIELKNSFSKGEVEVYNTVRRDHRLPRNPMKLSWIGGHIDSWDLGTGRHRQRNRNHGRPRGCTGSSRPSESSSRRTIRFVLFSGEEQGLHGSRAYAKTHEKELPKISGVLVHDMGTGRVKSIGLQARYDLRESDGRCPSNRSRKP